MKYVIDSQTNAAITVRYSFLSVSPLQTVYVSLALGSTYWSRNIKHLFLSELTEPRPYVLIETIMRAGNGLSHTSASVIVTSTVCLAIPSTAVIAFLTDCL